MCPMGIPIPPAIASACSGHLSGGTTPGHRSRISNSLPPGSALPNSTAAPLTSSAPPWEHRLPMPETWMNSCSRQAQHSKNAYRSRHVIELALRQSLRCLAVAGFLFGGVVGPCAAWADDASAGASVFKTECSECHSVKEGRNKKGPSLFGIVGRSAGTISDYSYSDAL